MKPKYVIGAAVAVLLLVVVAVLLTRSNPEQEQLQKQAMDAGADLRARESAVYSLEKAGPTSIPQLRAIMSDASDPPVKAAAISALARLRDWESMPKLLDLLDDPNELVRSRAGMAVSKMLGRDYFYRAADPPEQRGDAAAKMRRGYLAVGNQKPFPD